MFFSRGWVRTLLYGNAISNGAIVHPHHRRLNTSPVES